MARAKSSWLLAGVLCLALWPVAAHAQSPELMDAFNLFSELYAESRYQEALPFAEKAVALSEREFGPDHPDVAQSLNNLAALYHAQGRYAEAEPLYQRALAIDEKALGLEHPDLAIDINNLAGLYKGSSKNPRFGRG